MKKSRKTYQELKLLRDTLRQEKSSFYKVEPMEYNSEDVMIHYVQPKSEPILDFIKFLFFLMSLPFVIILMFIVLLTSLLMISIMSIKDWVFKKLF